MKVVFLDIDGVLVTRACLKGASGLRAKAAPECVRALNEITDRTGAVIVVSSTWRYYFDLYGMGRKLKEWGVRGEVVGATKDLTRQSRGGIHVAVERGDEIQKWLDDAPLHFGERVESFVILDDDKDMGHLEPYLVRTGMEHGLTPVHVELAVAMLMVMPSGISAVGSDAEGVHT